MATIVSAQSGNFSTGSTWTGGVIPVDGDSFTITAGHTVTIDSGLSTVATGYGDSLVYGILQHQLGATTTLRMNGVLYIKGNGCYHMRAGATCEINGTAAESHGIFLENEDGADFIAEGSDGMPSTTLSANVALGGSSISVSDASNFAAGEWIAIYDNTTSVTATNSSATMRDEGFWIHDISGTTIYIRQFVGPSSTVVSGSGTSLTVQNAKVFRTGQTLIFGTGNDRNIQAITGIDYNTNVITLAGNVTGNITGLTVYDTGTDKMHYTNEKVRKVATVTTAFSAVNTNTITVANATQFATGDDIWIEARSECGGTTDGSDDTYSTYLFTISSISGNTITLTSSLLYNVVSGALVTRMTRDVVVTVVDTASDFGYFWSDSYTANYNKKLIIKDVYFRKIGSSYSGTTTGVTLRGYHSTSSLPVTLTEQVPSNTIMPWLEGITYDQGASVRDWGGIWIYDARYSKLRCCVVHNANSGHGLYPEPGVSAYNGISVKNDTAGFRYEGCNEYTELAYCYASRNENAYRLNPYYEIGLGCHHCISDGVTQYSIMSYYNTGGPWMYRHRHTGSRYGFVSENSNSGLVYSQFSWLSGLTTPDSMPPGTPQAGAYYGGQIDRGWGGDQRYQIIEANFEYDAMQEFVYNSQRIWDNSESAWRVYNRYDSSDYGTGFWGETIFVPAGTTVLVSCQIKLPSYYSGNYPRLEARSSISQISVNVMGNTGGSWGSYMAGGNTTAQYTSAAIGAWEEKQLTIASTNFPRQILIGTHIDSSNTSEGYWLRPLSINFDRPYAVSNYYLGNMGSALGGGRDFDINDSFTNKKVRIGGRIG